jgi:hypothetical protein
MATAVQPVLKIGTLGKSNKVVTGATNVIKNRLAVESGDWHQADIVKLLGSLGVRNAGSGSLPS